MKRTIVPEILDSLDHADPAAQRSRRDLRRINFLMGNFRWIERAVRDGGNEKSLVEIGCGDGRLICKLAGHGYERVTAIDLVPPPRDLPANVAWLQEDMVSALPRVTGGTLIANLFWHHFSDDQLAALAEPLTRFDRIILSEPHRSRFALALGVTMIPWVNRVTRHDLFVSVRAGFRAGELPELWKLGRSGFKFRETTSPLGAYRLVAWRD